jgi:23S rRNA pseudouridine1911/1915/1917 synthase
VSREPLPVLYEDNHLLALNKPAGLATMGLSPGQPTLLAAAKEYIKRKYAKPGNVYLGVVSRLDAAVSGVVLLARTSKSAARLSERFRERDVEKTYWALVEGHLEPPTGECHDWLVKDEARRRVRICPAGSTGGREARLSYRRLALLGGDSLLEIKLHTGRKHQIRVQLGARGHPICGDVKYGSRKPFARGIALHARRLVLTHPVGRAAVVEIEAPLPDYWPRVNVERP